MFIAELFFRTLWDFFIIGEIVCCNMRVSSGRPSQLEQNHCYKRIVSPTTLVNCYFFLLRNFYIFLFFSFTFRRSKESPLLFNYFFWEIFGISLNSCKSWKRAKQLKSSIADGDSFLFCLFFCCFCYCLF